MNALRERFGALAPRERLLVGVSGVLLALLLLFVLVLRPLAGMKSRGEAAYARASATYLAVERAAARPAAPTGTGEPLRAVLDATAGRAGIVINRYDLRGEEVGLTVADTQAAALYAWLGILADEHGITVREGNVGGVGEGLVTARLTLARS